MSAQLGADMQATRLVKHSIIAIEAGDVAIDDEDAAEEDPLSQLRTAAEAAIQPPGTPDAGESERDSVVKSNELSLGGPACHPDAFLRVERTMFHTQVPPVATPALHCLQGMHSQWTQAMQPLTQQSPPAGLPSQRRHRRHRQQTGRRQPPQGSSRGR